jgi:hypothetical protein
MSGETIEYGLSVSLEASPRTPTTPCGNSDDAADVCYAPPRKQSFARLMVETEAEAENDDGEEGEDEPTTTTTREVSISPRVLFTNRAISGTRRRNGVIIRRNLSDDFFNLETSLSPVSFGTSTSVRIDAAASTAKKLESGVGECGVCYSQLPLHSNHVFTLCGHLFCLRCVLKWWDNATTCPICRAELLEKECPEAEAEADAEAEAGVADAEMAADTEMVAGEAFAIAQAYAEENNGIWMRREFWNDRVPHLIETDDESDAADAADNAPAPAYSSNDESSAATTPSVSPSHYSTRLTRYLYQDVEWNWAEQAHYDDSIIPTLNTAEIEGLRENREIAMTLFARMRFREILFDSGTHVTSSAVVAASAEPVHFTGVRNGAFIRKEDWTRIMYFQRLLWRCNSYHSVMYEFVIRRTSEMSPVCEVNIFGFVKDVLIQRVTTANTYVDAVSNDDDTNWQDIYEYAFVADVFTPTDFYLTTYGPSLRSYGGFNMEEGTITTQEVTILFSNVRRIYRICGHERS